MGIDDFKNRLDEKFEELEIEGLNEIVLTTLGAISLYKWITNAENRMKRYVKKIAKLKKKQNNSDDPTSYNKSITKYTDKIKKIKQDLSKAKTLQKKKKIKESCEIIQETDFSVPDAKLITKWWEKYNPFDDEGLWASEIKEMYLVGSRAKGTAKRESDYDIAVVFSKDLYDGISSIKLSERLHQAFGYTMPQFRGSDVDLQIFFDNDRQLKEYSKVKLK
jgi:predicted nucleotidyltransferase